MCDPYIIGIGHKARNGKDTLASYLNALCPLETKIFSFASALKGYCRVMGWMQEKDGALLQYVGTQCFRQFVEPDFWVKILLQEIKESDCQVAIIPDMRFPNEMKMIHQFGGMTICIRRLHPDGSFYIDTSRPASHSSETALDGAEFDKTYEAKSGDLSAIFSIAVGLHKELASKGILPPFSIRDGQSYFERVFA